MRTCLRIVVFTLAILFSRMVEADTIIQPTSITSSYTVTAIANGVNGCVNANGCWQVNGVLGANKSAALTQSVTLFQLPANGKVIDYWVKSLTACTGTTTLTTGVGTTGTADFYLASSTGYDLQAAVTNTNVSTAPPLSIGSDTVAATNIVASLTSTVANISSVVTGCSFKVSVTTVVAP